LAIPPEPIWARLGPWDNDFADLRNAPPQPGLPLYLVGAIRSSIPERIYGGDDEDCRFTFLRQRQAAEFLLEQLEARGAALPWTGTQHVACLDDQDPEIQHRTQRSHNLLHTQGPWTFGSWKRRMTFGAPGTCRGQHQAMALILCRPESNAVSPTYCQRDPHTGTTGRPRCCEFLSRQSVRGHPNGIDTKGLGSASDSPCRPFFGQVTSPPGGQTKADLQERNVWA